MEGGPLPLALPPGVMTLAPALPPGVMTLAPALPPDVMTLAPALPPGVFFVVLLIGSMPPMSS